MVIKSARDTVSSQSFTEGKHALRDAYEIVLQESEIARTKNASQNDGSTAKLITIQTPRMFSH